MPRLSTCTLYRLAGPLILLLTASACASSGAVPRPFPLPSAPAPAAGVPPPPARETPAEVPPPSADLAAGGVPTRLPLAVVGTAVSLLGSPYRNGGSTPDGFDCSGFTQWVFAHHGLELPRESREQFSTGVPVDSAAVAAGDLLFFSTVAPGASHVAIALDEDRFVHAPSSRGVVRIERRSSGYWSRRYLGARRLDLAPAEPRY